MTQPDDITESDAGPEETIVSKQTAMISRRGALALGIGVAALVGAGASFFNSEPAYAAWGGYSNGRIPASALAVIPWSPSHRLRTDARDALVVLNNAYRAQFGRDLTVNDAYRTYEAQVEAKEYWCSRGRCELAADAGTSNHGWALAIDIGVERTDWSNPTYLWMKANAPIYGWLHPAWAEPSGGAPEAWHWEYNGTTNPSLEDDLTPEQDNRLKNIENLLAVPGQGYGWTQVSANRIADVQSRLQVPNQGYDFLPAIINQLNAMTDQIAAIQAKLNTL